MQTWQGAGMTHSCLAYKNMVIYYYYFWHIFGSWSTIWLD